MKRSLALAFSFLIAFASAAQAAITTTGNVEPGDPSAWDGSTLAYIGKTSDGTVIVNSGSVISPLSTYLGYEPGSTGTATLSGTGSTWDSDRFLIVGYSGSGTLNILDGGVVNNSNHSSSSCGYLGYQTGATGSVNVTGVGSTWNNRFSVIGWFGQGELNITDGGTVNSAEACFVGIESGSIGIVTVSGANSSWKSDNVLVIGLKGNGELNITDGGTVNIAGLTELRINGGDTTAKIHFNNGTLTTGLLLAGSNQLGGAGTINTGGLIADGVDLIFDANHGLQQSFVMSGPNKNITFNIDCDHPYYMGAGYTGSGTLAIRDGLTVSSQLGRLGYHAGSSGTATVSGAGSMWEIASISYFGCDLDVGYRGTGNLNIIDGGTVSVQDVTRVACLSGSPSMIHFDNGTLNTGALFASSNQLTGTGTINTGGLVADGIDLVFDKDHGLQQTFTLAGQDKHIVVNLNQLGTEALGAGYTGCGTLTIRDGMVVNSGSNCSGSPIASNLGCQAGSNGIATVTGSGSTWNNSYFAIGYSGSGELNVTDGGTVISDSRTFIGYQSGSNGTVTVTGANSTWNNEESYIGMIGTAELRILDGGTVTSSDTYIGSAAESSSTVTVSGIGSTWKINSNIHVGLRGNGRLSVMDGGLLKVDGELTIDCYGENHSFVYMSTGGMLALAGEADESLDAFLDLINGTDAIRWWDRSISDWAPLTTATMGEDYTLEYIVDGELTDYTILTVGAVPEPSVGMLLLTAFVFPAVLFGRRNWFGSFEARRRQ